MTQYIPKAAVVEEIEKRTKMLDLDNPLGRGGMVELLCLKDKIDTLEVKEMSNIWHTISDRDVDLPKVGDVICFVKNGRVISGDYRSNKFYGKVNNGYDNSIEKGYKWCFLSDILSSVVEVKKVDLEKEMNDYFVSMEVQENENIFESTFRIIAKHFFNLGLKAQVNKI